MTPSEKYLFVADVIFALLSIWFFFPQCKMPLWQRLICVAIVWGINIVFFCYDRNNPWLLGYQSYFDTPCLWVALAAYHGWMLTERGRRFRSTSENFDRTHPKFLWGIVIFIFSLIPIVIYFILH